MPFEIITVVKDDLDGFLLTQDSLRIQTFKNFSWHVIDGSSSSSIKDRINFNILKKVRYTYLPPNGIYHAMNFGISKTESDWLWFLNAGDLLANINSTSLVEAKIRQHGAYDALGFTVNHIDADTFIWGITTPAIEEIAGTPFKICAINHQGFIAKTKSINEVGCFDENLHSVADSKLMDEFANTREIFLCEDHLVNFSIGGHSSKNFKKVLDELQLIRPYSKTSKIENKVLILKNQVRNYVGGNRNIVTRIIKKIRTLLSSF